MKNLLFILFACVALVGNAEMVNINNVNTVNDECVYKTGADTYAVISYKIKWPKEFKNIDAGFIEEFVVRNALGMEGNSVDKALEQHKDDYAKMWNGKIVKNVTKEQVLEMREKRSDVFEKSYPECEIEVDCSMWDNERNLLVMDVNYYIDNDNGVAAGESSDYKRVYLDCNSKRKIELEDLINENKHAALLQIVKDKLLSGDEIDCVIEENVKAMNKLPYKFDFDNFNVYMRFAKYDVTCGLAFNNSIGIAIEDINDMLTPYGKKLLMDNNSFKDNKTAAETKSRMQEYLNYYLKNLKEEKYNKLNDRKNFYTKEFIKNEKMCQAKAEAEGEEIGWIEYDTWVDAQEFYNLSFKIKRVLVRNHNEAMVELVVNNCDIKTVKRVIWKREGNKMCIDDYSTSGTMMRDMMEKYLK